MARRSPRIDRNDPASPRAGSLLFSFAALALFAGPPAAADERPHGTIELGTAAVGFRYAEYGPTGARIDGESGWIPAVDAAVEASLSRWFVRVEASRSSGDVDYDGRTQSANYSYDDLPAQTTTRAVFARGDAQLGAWLGARNRVAPYVGAGWRRWDRDIRPATATSRTGAPFEVPGLFEEYSWTELFAGIRWSFLRTERLDAQLDARFVHTVGSSVAVEWAGERPELDLGERPGARAAISFRYAFIPVGFIELEPFAEWRSFGKSAVDPVTHVFEPASETRNVGLRGGVGYRF